jgi:hypothetical protein
LQADAAPYWLLAVRYTAESGLQWSNALARAVTFVGHALSCSARPFKPLRATSRNLSVSKSGRDVSTKGSASTLRAVVLLLLLRAVACVAAIGANARLSQTKQLTATTSATERAILLQVAGRLVGQQRRGELNPRRLLILPKKLATRIF